MTLYYCLKIEEGIVDEIEVDLKSTLGSIRNSIFEREDLSGRYGFVRSDLQLYAVSIHGTTATYCSNETIATQFE